MGLSRDNLCATAVLEDEEKRLKVGSEAAGQRLDVWLTQVLGEAGRGRVRRLIEAGRVMVNGRRAKKGVDVKAGDSVRVKAAINAGAMPDPAVQLKIVHEDARLLVVDKPAGIHSHPLSPEEGGALVSGLLARYPQLASVGYGPLQPGIIHRLDRSTSGLMLVALDAECFEALRSMLVGGEIDKRYLALCSGAVSAPVTFGGYLRATGASVRVEPEAFDDAREVTTEVLDSEPRGDFSLLTLRAPQAARHQLRAQLSAVGHPIVGDERYGGAAMVGLDRHVLHASTIELRHPFTGKTLSLHSPLPPDLCALMTSLPRA